MVAVNKICSKNTQGLSSILEHTPKKRTTRETQDDSVLRYHIGVKLQ